MPCSEMLSRVALVRTDVSEECITSIIRVTRVSKLGMLAVTKLGYMSSHSISRQRVSVASYC
jgi:hypothetical protein